MSGSSGLSLEADIMRMPKGAGPGIVEDIPIPLGAWTLDSGVVLDATTTAVFRKPVAGSAVTTPLTLSPLMGLEWPAAATETARVSVSMHLPGQFRRGGRKSGDKPGIILRALAKQSGTGTQNTSLALNATAAWVNPSYSSANAAQDNPDETTYLTLDSALPSATLAPISVTALTSKYRMLEWKLHEKMVATIVNAKKAAERMRFWAAITITLGPSTTAGAAVTLNANTQIHVLATSLCIVRNMTYYEPLNRKVNI